MIDNKSVEGIGRMPSILASLAYREVTYKEEGEDTVALPESPSTGLVEDTHEKISKCLPILSKKLKIMTCHGNDSTSQDNYWR